ncbi:glycogenin-1 [Parasteatoda tepidariorum]|uniref:glycogenin-1 n=1 Tax=Parasteatoda tepidariorum TaxID=114398 RepID=UPI001C727662|nr:glycogenin-1 [Parasteatoda tepidariorum]XP_042899630.1 glycogenin-1 [Parasteatoda tepidariorum]
MEEGNFAFVTLATNETYSKGAIVLGKSLRLVSTKHRLVVLVTAGVPEKYRDALNKVYDMIMNVDELDSKDAAKLMLMARPELGVTFTKLHCWKLTQFSKCVFLDADTLVLKNCDELFEREELSAAPDVGWPDCFNSGVFVFKPSIETFNDLINFATKEGSFDGGDQGLLNSYFSDWNTKDISRHLSFIYNMTTSAVYTYTPAHKQFGQDVKIVHFLGFQKPWSYDYNETLNVVIAPNVDESLYNYLLYWWQVYSEQIKVADKVAQCDVSSSLTELSLSPKSDLPSSSPSMENVADGTVRMYEWEHGQIDYMGKDSFENIQKKLDDVINGSSKKDDS